MKLRFNFKEYTPIEVDVNGKDIDNLNIIFNYLNQGAKVIGTKDNEYYMDMSFEDEPISFVEWVRIKWFLIKNRFRNNEK